MAANDSKSTPTLIPYGTGSGMVHGTTIGATSTADEPSGAYSYTQTVWFQLTGVPAGPFFVAIRPNDPGKDMEMAVYDGLSASVSPSANSIAYPFYRSSFAGNPGHHAGQAAGGSVSFNVISYEPDGSGLDFTFGWGSYADTDPSHFGPLVEYDWVTWDTRVRTGSISAPAPDTSYPAPFSAVIGTTRGQFSVHYGYDTPPPFLRPVIAPNASQEACAWDNARYGNLNDAGAALECPGALGLAAGTQTMGIAGRPADSGYHASHASGGLLLSGYQSLYETSMSTGATDLIAPLNADRAYPYDEYVATNSWGVAFDDGTIDGSVGTNQLRNLLVGVELSDPNTATYDSNNRQDGQTWNMKMLALKASDQRGSTPTANKWNNQSGADWQDPFRSDQTELATLSVSTTGTQEVAIADPKPMLQSDAGLGVTVTPRHLRFLRYYFRSSVLAGSPASATIGNDYAERTFTFPYLVVDYKTQGHRLYYGFPLTNPNPDLTELPGSILVRYIPVL